ncbi:unnamed protein product [Durusdinium trenchii]|uniref:Uncharacterized protein n=1 Tax=Durusdinium trenchii TaxID=1381693 RepID=A0ABP0R3Z6_9DINO
MAVASSAAAVRALSVPQHQPYQTLARTSRIYDPPEAKGIDGQALAASSNPRTVSVHDQEPPGLGTIQEPCWPQLRLRGGQHVARNACGARQQRPDGPIEAGCHSGSPTRSRGRYQAWREARHGALPHRPKGRPANVEGRPGKLASLLNIPVQTGMTVEDLKKACRPLVAEIAQKPTPSKASGSTSSTERHVPETSMARPSQAPETIGAKAKASPGVTAQELQEVLTMQDHKFQGMLNQVLQSISTLHQASHLPGPMTSGPMETEATMEVNEVYEEQWHRAMDHFQNEIFVTTLTVGDEKSFQSHAMSENRLISKNPDLVENDRFPKTFVTEVYTNTERVAQTARKRGHRVGASMSLESGWNFLRPLDRTAARAVLKRESPFFLVLAFPCSFWSVLLNLNPPKNGTQMYEEAITLLQFALQLAKDQKSRGCHFVLENPQSSRAWTLEEMQRALEQLEARCVVFHQCRFRLKNQALVVGMEKQFEADFKRPHNTLAIEGGEEAEDETALPIDMNLSDSDQESTEAEAVSAYNSDINDAGVSPMQAAFGKQPRMHGDCLGDFGRRLSEHGLIDSRPSLARQVAMRETARLAMVRLHFSKGTSPFPEAVRAAFEQRRQSVSSAAPSASGESQASKRPAELDAERLREEALQPDPVAPTPVQPPDEVPDEASEALRVTHEVMEMEAYANVHPLRQIQIMAEQDRLNPLEARVRDHGTWRGNWPLPSRTEFKRRQMLKQLWPLGNDDAAQEVLAVLTARKEHVWSHMSDFEKKEFREAAAKGWSVWVENEAIEPLPDAEAARISMKWKLASADIKSAFMKGEEFGPNERILYLANVKTRVVRVKEATKGPRQVPSSLGGPAGAEVLRSAMSEQSLLRCSLVVPSKANAHVLESSILDYFAFTDRAVAFKVSREVEWAPVRDIKGRHTADAARLTMHRLHCAWVRAAGGTIEEQANESDTLEVSPLLSYEGEGLGARPVPGSKRVDLDGSVLKLPCHLTGPQEAPEEAAEKLDETSGTQAADGLDTSAFYLQEYPLRPAVSTSKAPMLKDPGGGW